MYKVNPKRPCCKYQTIVSLFIMNIRRSVFGETNSYCQSEPWRHILQFHVVYKQNCVYQLSNLYLTCTTLVTYQQAIYKDINRKNMCSFRVLYTQYTHKTVNAAY